MTAARLGNFVSDLGCLKKKLHCMTENNHYNISSYCLYLASFICKKQLKEKHLHTTHRSLTVSMDPNFLNNLWSSWRRIIKTMTVADVSNLYFFIYLPYLTKFTPKLIVHLLFGFMQGLHTCVFIVTFLFNVKGACSQFLKKMLFSPFFLC